ncbi:hypothetical protein [Rhodopirellula sp. MGV]|uniref:hypothetical protein n=1 Tax=Rhodopirellula sp. MGV TaxID=2023130 RepID=UPI000B965F90|nr:hypothetical protein [Rhodopirellula sp. MGV]OYP34348.1 hypothetical protein CGZ80_14895 [Rhodopirellula sp. MGV]PNY35250.1 hypothetical protein C2E31_19085 [Rhodopirellula baltica]
MIAAYSEQTIVGKKGYMDHEPTSREFDSRRRWGSDALGVLYIAVSILAMVSFRDPNPIVQTVTKGVGTVLLIAGIGLIARVNIIRKFLVGMLYLSIGVSGLLIIVYLCQLAGLIGELEALPAKRSLLRSISRMTIAWYTLSYLTRSDVVEEYEA